MREAIGSPTEVATSERVRLPLLLCNLADSTYVGTVLRYGGAAYVYKTTGDSLLSTGYLGVSTAAIECGAAVGAPALVRRENALTRFLNKNVDRVMARGVKVNPLAAALIANTLGVTAMEYAYSRETAGHSDRELKRRGLIAAACITAYTTAQGPLMPVVLEHYTDPRVITGAVGLIGGAALIKSMARRKVEQNDGE